MHHEVNRPSPVVNHAGIVVTDPLGNTLHRDATATVRIFEPAIHLNKSVSADLVPIGSTVTYTFEVTNAGTVPTTVCRPKSCWRTSACSMCRTRRTRRVDPDLRQW